MNAHIPVTMVNHVAIAIEASPDTVWGRIIEDYIEARKFRESGAIEPLDDPSAVLGGYRIRLGQDGAIDERIVHVTERDEAARRLSLFADYLSVPGGLLVYATYQAHPIDGGARFTIDCHSRTGFERPSSGETFDLAKAMADATRQADAQMMAYLEDVKAQLESLG